MSKDKLIVEPDDRNSDHHRLVWWLAEDADIGGTLGDGETHEQETLNDHNLSSLDRECVIAYLTAKSTAIKNDGGAPWPAWTKDAIAAGWKAPKGWKP